MNTNKAVSAINWAMLLLFVALAATATVIAVHEIFFSLPECPGGSDTCMMRDGHWNGSKLVWAILIGAWVTAALWWYASRVHAWRGRTPWALMPFWLFPIFVLANLLPIFF